MICRTRFGMGFEGNGSAIFKALPHKLPKGADRTHGNPQRGKPMLRERLDQGISP
jgi:hypothetical protein